MIQGIKNYREFNELIRLIIEKQNALLLFPRLKSYL
jgi:hypothetical protein